MTTKGVRREIERYAANLLEHEVAIEISAVVIREAGGKSVVTWSSGTRSAMPRARYRFGTIAEYRRLLEDRQFTILLYDGGLIRAQYEFRRNDVVAHSLGYYPCPVVFPDEYLNQGVSIGEIVDHFLSKALEERDWEVYFDGSGVRSTDAEGPPEPTLLMRGPFRFDYDPEAEGDFHPASHVHLSVQECRLPVHAPLSFGQFMSFVFRNFYQHIWSDHSFIRDWPSDGPDRCILPDHESVLHLNHRTMDA